MYFSHKYKDWNTTPQNNAFPPILIVYDEQEVGKMGNVVNLEYSPSQSSNEKKCVKFAFSS